MSERIIDLRNISLSNGSQRVLDGVTTSFREGRTTVIVGPSGCGKSVLLKVAAGIVIPDSGVVTHRGTDISRFSRRQLRAFRRESGFVFQDAALWANRSVFDNLSLPLQIHGFDGGRNALSMRIFEYLERLDFRAPPTVRPAALSTGEQKMISFLRAVIGEPRLLFLDEPTGSIDHTAAGKILEMMQSLRHQGVTMILATHSARITSMLADDLVVLSAGKILAAGEVAEVSDSKDPRVAAILEEILGRAATYDDQLLDLLNDGFDNPGPMS